MMEKLLEVLVGQLPEAIYFALFLLFTKELKEKKLKFILIVCAEYLLAFQAIRFELWSHIMFFVLTYLTLKLLYNEKAQLTDIFTMSFASILLIAISLLLYYPILYLFNHYVVYVVIGRISLFIVLFLLRKKLYKIQKLYKKFWNRNDSIPKPIKSTTFRAINTIAFNVMFFTLNIGMILECMFFTGR